MTNQHTVKTTKESRETEETNTHSRAGQNKECSRK